MIRCGCVRARFEGKMICGRRAKRSLCVVAALTSLRLVYRSVRARFFVYTSLGLQLSREPVSDDRARWSIHSLFPHIQHHDPPPYTHTQTDMARCLLPALAVYVTDFSCVYSTSGWPTTDDCQLSITPILSQSGIPAFEPHDQRIFLSARILSFFFRLFLRFCFDIRR